MNDSSARVTTAKAAAQSGATAARADFRGSLSVETKEHKNDLVTQADRSSQRAITSRIRTAYPDERIVAEEGAMADTVPEEGTAWVVDPIDGTGNYVKGSPIWTTTVASVVDGDLNAAATILPAIGDSYIASKEETRLNDEPASVSDSTDTDSFVVGVLGNGAVSDNSRYASLTSAVVESCGDLRRFGSTTAALAFVAAGQLDAAITAKRKNPWDILAGSHTVECAGGTVTRFDGEPWTVSDELIVASNGQAHDFVLQLTRDAVNYYD